MPLLIKCEQSDSRLSLNVSNHYDDIVAVNAIHFHYDNSIISEDPPFHKTSAKSLGDTGWKKQRTANTANMVSNCIG